MDKLEREIYNRLNRATSIKSFFSGTYNSQKVAIMKAEKDHESHILAVIYANEADMKAMKPKHYQEWEITLTPEVDEYITVGNALRFIADNI